MLPLDLSLISTAEGNYQTHFGTIKPTIKKIDLNDDIPKPKYKSKSKRKSKSKSKSKSLAPVNDSTVSVENPSIVNDESEMIKLDSESEE